MHKAIYLLSIDTKFNKEKLVYLMRCAYTRDNFQHSTFFANTKYSLQYYLHAGLCLVVDFVSLSMLEVTLLRTKSHENEKSSGGKWNQPAHPNTKSEKWKIKNEFSWKIFRFCCCRCCFVLVAVRLPLDEFSFTDFILFLCECYEMPFLSKTPATSTTTTTSQCRRQQNANFELVSIQIT